MAGFAAPRVHEPGVGIYESVVSRLRDLLEAIGCPGSQGLRASVDP